MSEKRVESNIQIRDARLILRNFEGRETEYNDPGKRNFGVLLDEELAVQLEQDGWNVKRFNPKEDDPEHYCQPWLQVKVKFNPFPPVVVLIKNGRKMHLDEETVGEIDYLQIAKADLVIRPYNYPAMRGKDAGVAAYLKALYITAQEDEFAAEYADIPDVD